MAQVIECERSRRLQEILDCQPEMIEKKATAIVSYQRNERKSQKNNIVTDVE